MNNEERLEVLKRMKEAILSPPFRTSLAQRREWLNQVVPLLNFNSHYHSNAIPVADILSRAGFSTSMYEHAEAHLQSLVGQAIAELEQNLTPSADLPNVRKARQTQLAAWPVISSLLFDIADSDTVCSIAGVAGLEVDWTLSKTEAFSHRTRNRAYRPKVETAYRNLNTTDQATVLSVIAAELGRKYPQQLKTIRSALTRVGWTIKTTPDLPAEPNRETPLMKRDRELQKLLLLQVRDGQEPPQLSQFSEADQVYNAALLINAGLVEGEAIQGGSGEYVSTVMTQLTSAGHDFLDKETPTSEASLESVFPTELAESLKRFRKDHPNPSRCAFIMMRFGTTKAHNEIAQSIRNALGSHGIKALRADDKDYHDDLFWNILTYIYGCHFGIAVFERIEQEEFNPNISLEVGYMMALRKPVLLLKDRTLKNLNTDLIGKLYKTFDPQSISDSVRPQLERWLTDKGLIHEVGSTEYTAFADIRVSEEEGREIGLFRNLPVIFHWLG